MRTYSQSCGEIFYFKSFCHGSCTGKSIIETDAAPLPFFRFILIAADNTEPSGMIIIINKYGYVIYCRKLFYRFKPLFKFSFSINVGITKKKGLLPFLQEVTFLLMLNRMAHSRYEEVSFPCYSQRSAISAQYCSFFSTKLYEPSSASNLS